MDVDENLRGEIERKIAEDVSTEETESLVEEISEYGFIDRIVGSRKGDIILVIDPKRINESQARRFSKENYAEKLEFEGEIFFAQKL